MVDRVDVNGVPLRVGDTVILARPAQFNKQGARLEKAEIVKFTATGVTVSVTPEFSWQSEIFSTPYRADKFWRLSD